MQHKHQTATISKLEKETSLVTTIYLDTKVKAKPGQYVMVWLPRENEKPFGVASDDPLMLSIAAVGPISKKITSLKVGDKISWRGPYGKGFSLQGKRPLLVAGGYGVVPLHFLASKLPKATRKKTTVILGAKDKKNLPMLKKFEKLGCRALVTTDDGSKGFKGFSTELAAKELSKHEHDSLFACGPEPMMKAAAKLARKHKIFCHVSLESFFKCGGMGLCGECSHHGKLVCVDGPVVAGKVLSD